MSERRMVVVAREGWIGSMVAGALRERGAEVRVATRAHEGVTAVCAWEPLILIADARLEDKSGAWLVQRIREEPSVGTTPCLILAGEKEHADRVNALLKGADACISKPFRVEELLAQVDALVAMSQRCRQGPRVTLHPPAPASEPVLPPSSRHPSALEGDVAHLSLPTVLTVLEMERRSGVLTVAGARNTASVVLSHGVAASGTFGGTEMAPLQVVRRVLAWKTGRFIFRPGEAVELGTSHRSIGALLIEAARLDDEGVSPSSVRPGPKTAKTRDESGVRRSPSQPAAEALETLEKPAEAPQIDDEKPTQASAGEKQKVLGADLALEDLDVEWEDTDYREEPPTRDFTVPPELRAEAAKRTVPPPEDADLLDELGIVIDEIIPPLPPEEVGKSAPKKSPPKRPPAKRATAASGTRKAVPRPPASKGGLPRPAAKKPAAPKAPPRPAAPKAAAGGDTSSRFPRPPRPPPRPRKKK